MPNAPERGAKSSANGTSPRSRSARPNGGEVPEGSGGTRELLLAAARRVLLEDGLPAVTTRRVANAAKVNQALVHYHFGSIENLLLEVLDTVAHDTRRAERIFYGQGDLRAKWRTFMDDLLTREVPDGTTKIWAETVVMVSSKPETRERYVERIAAPTHERLFEVVRSGLPEDTPEEDLEGLAALILAVRKVISLDSLVGWDRGHEALLRLVDEIIAQRVADEDPTSTDGTSNDWPQERATR